MWELTAGPDNQTYFYETRIDPFPTPAEQKAGPAAALTETADDSLSLEAISAETSCRRRGFQSRPFHSDCHPAVEIEKGLVHLEN